MTSEEVREAEHRIRSVIANDFSEAVVGLRYGHYDTQVEQFAAIDSDWETLGRAYLARLAADEQREREDAEPGDDAWFAEQFKACCELRHVLQYRAIYDYWVWEAGGFFKAMKTRGDVRRLLEALKGGGT